MNHTQKEETMNGQRIEGAVALVTGANRGIGRALTEALLARGVRKVYATARNPEALSALRDERLVALRLDVTDADQIRAAAEAASDVELVFNNAGVALAGSIAGAAVLDQARREMEVNYFGPLRLLQCLAPSLARNGGGVIVNIGSAAGLTNVPLLPTYSASKAALHSLTQAARILLGAQGTRSSVSTQAPWTQTWFAIFRCRRHRRATWRSPSSTASRPATRTSSRIRSRWISAGGSSPRRRPRNGRSPQ